MNLHPVRAAVVALASTTLLTGAVIAAAPANADTPICVSTREYNRIETDMTLKKAHQIFDFKGRRIGIDGNQQVRDYDACGDEHCRGTVGLDLVREDGTWRVVNKFRLI